MSILKCSIEELNEKYGYFVDYISELDMYILAQPETLKVNMLSINDNVGHGTLILESEKESLYSVYIEDTFEGFEALDILEEYEDKIPNTISLFRDDLTFEEDLIDFSIEELKNTNKKFIDML